MSKPTTVVSYTSNTPYSANECIGKDKDVVKKNFSNCGFYNIETEAVEDLKTTEAEKYGKVIAVSINGITDFEGNAEYKKSAQIVIKYHTFIKIPVPFSSEEIKNMDAASVAKAFEEAGFFHVSTEEKYDLDPDETAVDFENIITVDGVSKIEKGGKYPPNATIKIVTHKPYEKYTLKVVIDFVPNIIFSKYDVNFEIAGHSEKLTHGNDAEFQYRLKPGNYTLNFTSSESDSVKGSIELKLDGDTEACYKISCTSEKINVETLYIENKGAIGEGQAMVPSSANDCKYKNYKDVEKSFSDAGFTNITTSILYDIILGITEEGDVYRFCEGNGENSCDKVKITSGSLNDVLIITYHDGSDVWSEGLHFKWKNQPDHLILQDNDGFEYDYYSTDLNDALALRDRKTIHNY